MKVSGRPVIAMNGVSQEGEQNPGQKQKPFSCTWLSRRGQRVGERLKCMPVAGGAMRNRFRKKKEFSGNGAGNGNRELCPG